MASYAHINQVDMQPSAAFTTRMNSWWHQVCGRVAKVTIEETSPRRYEAWGFGHYPTAARSRNGPTALGRSP